MPPSSPTPPIETWPQSRRWRRPALLVASIVAVVVAVRAALPFAIAWGIAREGSRALGRSVAVEDVELGLLHGRAAVRGLWVGGPLPEDGRRGPVDPKTAVAGLRELRVSLRPLALLHRELRLAELDLEGPVLRLQRGPGGRIAPLVLAEPEPEPEPEPPEAQPEAPGEPWAIALDRLRIADTEVAVVDRSGAGRGTLADFQLAELVLGGLALRGADLAVGSLSLREPRLQVQREFAFSPGPEQPAGAAAPPPPPAAAAAEGGAEPAAAYRLSALDVDDARLTLLTEGEPLAVRLDLHVRDASLAPAARFPVQLQLGLGDASVSVDGQLGLLPPAFEGRLGWARLSVPTLIRSLALELPVEAESVSSSGELDVAFQLGAGEAPGSLRVSGEVDAENLAATARDGGARFGATAVKLTLDELALSLAPGGAPDAGHLQASARAEGLSFDEEAGGLAAKVEAFEVAELRLPYPVPGSPGADPQAAVTLGTVRIVSPALRYVRGLPPRAQPQPEAAEPEPATEAEQAAAPATEEQTGASAPPAVRLGRLDLSGGSLNLLDRTTRPPYRGRVTGLRVDARALRWPEREVGSLSVDATGPGGARLRVRGKLGRGAGQVKLTLRSLGLEPFDPYAEPSGYRLSGGSASLESVVKLRRDVVGVDAKVVVDDLDVGSEGGAFQAAFGVPLDLALALLKDTAGRISLPIAFESEQSELRTQLGTTVLSVLRQALVGALTLPLKILQGAGGAVVGLATGGGDTVNAGELAAVVGSEQPTAAARDSIDALARLLAERPQLGVELRGRTGPEDLPLLALQELVRRVRAGEDLPDVEDEGLLAPFRVRGALDDHGVDAAEALDADDRALLERYQAAVPGQDARAKELARARAEAVRDDLVEVHGIQAARISLGAPEQGPPGVVAQLGVAAAPAADAGGAGAP